MRHASLTLLPFVLSGCAIEWDEDELGHEQLAVLEQHVLQEPIVLDCGANERAIDSDTIDYINLNAGDELLVGGDALIEYTDPPDAESDELVQTWLACKPAPINTGATAYPTASQVLSRTGQNVWQVVGYGNTSDAHGTRAVYTATVTDRHVCWLVYGCSTVDEADFPSDSHGSVTVQPGAALHNYSPNQYPGINVKTSSDVAITSTAGTQVQVVTWNAQGASQADDEVVVRWSPHVTTCLSNDDYCSGLAKEPEHPGFYWRISLWQYNSGTLCNTQTGVWSARVPCEEEDHHCDVRIFTTVFPIITGGTCGTTTAQRTFRAFASIAKASDGWPWSDLVVNGGTETNLTMYSR